MQLLKLVVVEGVSLRTFCISRQRFEAERTDRLWCPCGVDCNARICTMRFGLVVISKYAAELLDIQIGSVARVANVPLSAASSMVDKGLVCFTLCTYYGAE